MVFEVTCGLIDGEPDQLCIVQRTVVHRSNKVRIGGKVGTCGHPLCAAMDLLLISLGPIGAAILGAEGLVLLVPLLFFPGIIIVISGIIIVISSIATINALSHVIGGLVF